MKNSSNSEFFQVMINFDKKDPFDIWADSYFNSDRMRVMIPKFQAIESFQKYIDNYHFTAQRFSNELERYCREKQLCLNPEELKNSGGRVIRKYKNRATEMIYIQPNEY